MTQLSEYFSVDLLSVYGQFRGSKFTKMIEFGVDNSSSAILLEGVMLFCRNMGFKDEEDIKTNVTISPMNNVADDVGSLSFCVEGNEARCRIELTASQTVFDDIYATLCTLRENYLYNFSIITNSDKLVQTDNTIRKYILTFVERTG
jgi:hypothetical protein